MTSVRLTIESTTAAVKADQQFNIRGRISSDRGALKGAAISLRSMGRDLANTLSGIEGDFQFKLDAKNFPPGKIGLVAHFTPAMIWRRSASSNKIQITVLPPTPIPVRFIGVDTRLETEDGGELEFRHRFAPRFTIPPLSTSNLQPSVTCFSPWPSLPHKASDRNAAN